MAPSYFLWAAVLTAFCSPEIIRPAELLWHAEKGFRRAEVQPIGNGRTGFTSIPAIQSGLSFTNDLPDAESLRNRILENGSGVAAGDFDGDGLCDLYFCRLTGPNALYRNLGGWRFEEVALSAGVACQGQYSTSAVFADLNGDGRLDLLVGSLGGGVRVFMNTGSGKFQERFDSGLSRTSGTMSLALADVDGNGTLDLYVANYRSQTVKDFPVDLRRFKVVNGRWQVPPEYRDRFVSALDATGHPILHENGEPDVLYLNDGKGFFTPVSWTDGHFLDEHGRPLAKPPFDWSLSAMFRDLDGDGRPDLYVCSDFVQPDRLWLNLGQGRFQEAPRWALTKTSRFSMSIDFADLNRDGFDDFFVVDMLSPSRSLRMQQRNNVTPAMFSDYTDQQRPQFSRNTLFMNRGDGSFAELARLAGVQATDWSWSTIFLDVDLDGFEDILIGNGSIRDAQNSDVQDAIERRRAIDPAVERQNAGRLLMPSLLTPNLLFRNRGNFSFEEVGRAWGFASTNISVGMALADLDNDGDLDVVINTMNSAAEIYRNNSPAKRIAVRLKGRAPNTRGIGARIRIEQPGFIQEQEMICGGRYLSSDDPVRTFAAQPSKGPMTLCVRWPSGAESRIPNARPDSIYEVFEPDLVPAQPSKKPDPARFQNPGGHPKEPSTFFEDAAGIRIPRHRESVFDDEDRQPLLARQLSRWGPPVAVADLNGDGWDDVIIGNGAGSPPAILLNRHGAGFEPLELQLPSSIFAGDQTSWVVVPGSKNSLELLCGISNYENPAATNAVLRFEWRAGALMPLKSIPAWGDSVGPLCSADVNRDGAPDLFVGGRMRPGRYPAPASSKLFLRKDGEFVEDKLASAQFRDLGLVTGAVFADLNNDGWPDLILACEWGPIRVFMNDHGAFAEATERMGLSRISGLWTCVQAADFNHDGQVDIVAGNWGRNTKYQQALAHPISIYYGELDPSLPFFQTETYFDPELKKQAPWLDRDALAALLPSILERFPTRAEYARAGIDELLGSAMVKTHHADAATLDTTLFLNDHGRFKAVPLPQLEAQIAPCFGIAMADFNGDGNLDLFLNQNFSGTELETSPCNDGVGALLLGDGRGGFAAVPPLKSGIKLEGDGRGCAALDFNKDGAPDLIATQNNRTPHLLLNRNRRTAGRSTVTGR